VRRWLPAWHLFAAAALSFCLASVAVVIPRWIFVALGIVSLVVAILSPFMRATPSPVPPTGEVK